MDRTEELYVYIKEELLNLAYKNLFTSSFAVILNSTILVYLLWGEVANADLSLWLVLMSLITLFRFKSAYRFKFYKDEYPIEIWNSIFLWGIVLSAILWGCVSLFLFPDTIEYQMIVIIILAGMGAGATSSLASHINAIRLFLFLILTPLIVRLFLEETYIYNTLAILTIIFLIMLLVVSKQFYITIYNNVETKLLFKQAKDKLKVTQDSFQTIFNQAPSGIFYYDRELKIDQLNQEFSSILQAPKEKLIGLDIKRLPDQSVLPAIEAVFDGINGFYEGSYKTKIQQLNIWIMLRTSPIYDSSGKIIGGVGIVSDITAQIEAQKKIEYQAFYDSLTSLPNRSMLMDRLKQAIIHYKNHNIISAVLFLDLDHFKKTNDSLGHNIGDKLLISSAKRLGSIVSDEDIVARLGGDEFVILLSNLGKNLSHAITLTETISNRVHESMQEPFVLDGHTLNVSTSIGIVILNSSKDTPDDLLKYADTAMYQSKRDGRGKSSFYQDEMNIELKRRLDIENVLRGAIDKDELEVYYQPMIEFKTKRLIGAEALIRIDSQQLGNIYPDEFIPIAEETGLILPIGEWVMREAIVNFLEWNHLHSDYPLERIAINISTKQFSKDNFIELVKDVIYTTKVDPKCVELELTESIIIKDIKESISKMNELRQMGIGISIDDFGTGYSSLSYLKMLPFSSLKIDRSFTQDIVDEDEEQKLINSIISIAKSFNMHIIAEGIESDIQYNYLEQRGCDYFQGYYCSKPINAMAFEEFIKKKYNTSKNEKKSNV